MQHLQKMELRIIFHYLRTLYDFTLDRDSPHMQYQVIIIGGGAAGLVAAIIAGRQKSGNVLIIERNDTIGKKILVTGNGRCNLTNTNLSPGKYYGENTKCLHNIFNRFSCDDAMKFFEGLGVKLKTETDGRVFPFTDRASTIVDALSKEISRLKVKVNLKERVVSLIPIENGWEVKTDKNVYYTKSVILTIGGKSYPQLGSTGDGYDIARKLGHRIVEPRPALVPLELEGNWFKKLQGVKADVEIILTAQEKLIIHRTGELLFTHFGISGPAVLNLSRLIIDYQGKTDFSVLINFLPNYKNSSELDRFLKECWQAEPKKKIINTLIGLTPKKLCFVLLSELNIDTDKQISQMTKKEMQLLAEKLTRWQLQIKRPRSFKESMVTAGGVSIDEINPKTMESFKAKGLYFAGEILDIDGVSGGYNLQFAWSTGYLAGPSVRDCDW